MRFQVMNVTVLPDGMLSAVDRNAHVQARVSAKLDSKRSAVLVAGRTLDGESVHVQMHVPTGFRMRLPFSWTSVQVKKLAAYLKADAGYDLQQLVNLVY